ncbi:hypothetical protein LOC67_00570 [Stieleria sp. JC731]|uniref:hypothetical protein n=1 Tax=Pirellulaceae TaxID=2691357 RepID=UPI001E2CE48C|nr:hypothetical protein [Stieleria sp. JC731]MCC9599034.1 hypothetical protein [Stieleria sp. JC731]
MSTFACFPRVVNIIALLNSIGDHVAAAIGLLIFSRGVVMVSESEHGQPENSPPENQLRHDCSPKEPNTPEEAVPTQKSKPAFVRFLYNQNPFYLISCLLVIYGCQSLVATGESLLEKTIMMGGGILAYGILMALVCVGVVRIAKVWDDARSIFIVVIISLIAMTTSFDELSIWDRANASLFAALAAIAVAAITESTLLACRIRLRRWYRLAYYAYFLILIGAPLILGRAVAERNDPLANWGAVLFSIGIAVSMLLLIPAIRQANRSTANNGTPWSWPLYPLSAFIVMYVLAGVRSHAIWMSFGFYGTVGSFEPFLLLPIAAAALVLCVESGLANSYKGLLQFALYVTPVLLVCGSANSGQTQLPIKDSLQLYAGSAIGISGLVVTALYAYYAIRGLRGAIIGVPLTLSLLGAVATIPQWLITVGVDRWVLFALAAGCWFAIAFRSRRPEWIWLLHGVSMAITVAIAGRSIGYTTEALILGSVYLTVVILIVGAIYEGAFAEALRVVGACLVSCGGLALAYQASLPSRYAMASIVLAMAILCVAYAYWVRRRAWLGVALLNLCLCITALSYQGHRNGRLYRLNWPIASGIASLGIGLAITTGKSGAFAILTSRLHQSRENQRGRRVFQAGF